VPSSLRASLRSEASRRAAPKASAPAAGRIGFDLEVAADLCRDAVRGGQAESRAAAARLRREERFDRVREHLGGHAAAGVADRQPHVVAGGEVVVRAGGAVDVEVRRFDQQGAAVRHRVTRVGEQDMQDVKHLLGVRRRGPDQWIQPHVERDVVADDVREDVGLCVDDVVDADRDRLERRLAAEELELTGEAGGSLRRIEDPVEILQRHAARVVGHAPFRQLVGDGVLDESAEGQDRAEQVVVVVCDTTGEPAQAVQPLTDPQLRIHIPAPGLGMRPLVRLDDRGDVVDHADRPRRPAVFGHDHAQVGIEPAGLPAGAWRADPVPALDVVHRVLAHRGQQFPAPFRAEALQPTVAEQRTFGQSHDGLQPLVHIRGRPALVDQEDADR
jgi:hypothetical protein